MEKQIQYLVSWFGKWSELQKEDFFFVLTGKFNAADEEALLNMMETLKVGEKPPSLFKCQMKLFNEWFDCWSESERGSLMVRLKELDNDFIQKVETRISASF